MRRRGRPLTNRCSVDSAQPLLWHLAALAMGFDAELARRSETHIFVLPTLTPDKRFRVVSIQRVTFPDAWFVDMLDMLNLKRPEAALNDAQRQQKAAFSKGVFPNHRISVMSGSGNHSVGSSASVDFAFLDLYRPSPAVTPTLIADCLDAGLCQIRIRRGWRPSFRASDLQRPQ